MKKKFLCLTLFIFIVSCSGGNGVDIVTNPNQNTNQPNPPSNDWLIPLSQVKDGGPGKDGIPSIDSPIFIPADDPGTSFIANSDLIIGILKGDNIRAYPHSILNWHEIVNDLFSVDFVVVNYCPLTGTAFAWDGIADGTKSEFGVSGLLYNANLILYDRNTDSHWSQLKLQCVNGELIGDEPTLLDIIETDWATWKSLYPNSEVLSRQTGFYNENQYLEYPYGDYRTDNNYFIFTATPLNNALPSKERIYAIIDDDLSRVYQFSKFTNGNSIKEEFNGKSYLIIGDENLIKAFELTGDYKSLEFEYKFQDTSLQDGFFADNEGNIWSAFGEALSGPRIGERLVPSKSVVSYWFAIAAFYPNPEIYSE